MVQFAPLAPTRARPPATGGGTAARAPAARRPPVWRELLLVVVFYGAYSLVRVLLNDPDGPVKAFANAARILDLERALSLDVELALNRALLASESLATAANLFYLSAHFLVTLAVLVWLYRSHPAYYTRMRTAIVAATGLALVGFWLFPLAPPRFLPGEGFADPVVLFDTPGLYSSGVSAAMANQYAAMPSMHAGWAVWCGIALVALGRHWWTRALGVLYPAATILVIMATANHYVLDAVAGVALVVLALAAVKGPAPLSGRSRRTPAR
ncbi:phosphatase PAP2 family protein [Actinocorallia sp. API 0066]|uniref:phosphatase PAP2 family protein n=1 Tax=Actinocorallia sp. API 0066 TaxID=2896846 RepID=UPI001E4BAA9A|nr:phosphatase PAP2 family protein [Actinocorallia sp. API 0066]MCD0451028.1 phosphatase PAP2 family protein [Actinocorallia sp. API 0066]